MQVEMSIMLQYCPAEACTPAMLGADSVIKAAADMLQIGHHFYLTWCRWSNVGHSVRQASDGT